MELATQSEFDEVLNRHHNIQYVDAIFTDLCGYVRGKRFPLLEADKIFFRWCIVTVFSILLRCPWWRN